MRLLLIVLGTLWLGIGVVRTQPPTAPVPAPSLGDLVAEYKRLGMPFPPADAQLVRVNWERYIYLQREESDTPYRLNWRVPPAKRGDRVRYLELSRCGAGWWETYVEPAAVEETAPTANALRGVNPYDDGSYYLVLAVQCENRGWHELAAALYFKARERFLEDKDSVPVISQLRHCAWYYWYHQESRLGSDRKEVLRRLKAIAAEEPSFLGDGDAQKPYIREAQFPELSFRWYLRMLELAVAPTNSKPGTIEALIDDLTNFHLDCNSPFVPSLPDSVTYWKLVELGFDAVPALIEHANDERLTRAWFVAGNLIGSHPLTVGDVCISLLKNLSTSYSIGSSSRIDPKLVREWFAEANRVGEEKWLVDHAIPVGTGGPSQKQIVRVIAAKYPDRLTEIYRAMLKQPVEERSGFCPIDDFVAEIIASRLPSEKKFSLLEEGATCDSFWHRLFALEGLAQLDRKRMRQHLIATLKLIQTRVSLNPKTPDRDRLQSFVALVDDQAGWRALEEAAKTVDAESRISLIYSIGPETPPDWPDPQRRERIRFLMHFLNDRSAEVDEDGSRTEVRDRAAAILAGLVGLPVRRMGWEPPCTPAFNSTQGPLSRLLFREAVRQAAWRMVRNDP